MESVGLRELRQDASELVRRVEAGEEIDITVSGRLAARMVLAKPKQWLTWDEIADAFGGRPDPIGTGTATSSISPLRIRGTARNEGILDTSVLIATDVPALEGELAVSAAALAELHFGVLMTSDPADPR